MIIALPLTDNDEFSAHYGGASKVNLFQVDPDRRSIVRETTVVPSEAEPCAWADWLKAQGVDVFLAGGMGMGAQQRMAAAGILVTVGVRGTQPRSLVQAWLDNSLIAGANACEGGHQGHHHGHNHGGHEHGHSCHCSSH